MLAKNPSTGKYDAFEVKSSTVGKFNLSKDQMDPENFVKTRVNNAVANGKINKRTRRDIMTNLGDRKVAYVGIKRGEKGNCMQIPSGMRIGIQKQKDNKNLKQEDIINEKESI